MIEYLSPREVEELSALLEAGDAWPRLILEVFADSSARLRLGWDEARAESALAGIVAEGSALRAALERAARWCAEHGLHLLSFEETGPVENVAAERRWFMAVG
jgi:transcriptional regulator with AAA-type ATPase domain